VWSALQKANSVDGLVRQVEWGAYECTLAGSGVRQLLSTVLATGDGWRDEPLASLDVGHRRLMGHGGPEPLGARNLGWLWDNVADEVQYVVTAEVF